MRLTQAALEFSILLTQKVLVTQVSSETIAVIPPKTLITQESLELILASKYIYLTQTSLELVLKIGRKLEQYSIQVQVI